MVPAHSFKFAAALQAATTWERPAYIRIETKAGHGAGKPIAKQIEEEADKLAFAMANVAATGGGTLSGDRQKAHDAARKATGCPTVFDASSRAAPGQSAALLVGPSWRTQYFRKGFGLKGEIGPQLTADYASRLVDLIRERDYTLEVGPLTFRLAREFGFCYGVDRAVEYAYETRTKFPDRRIFLVGEIIHNPHVNARLQEMGIAFLRHGPGRRVRFLRASRPMTW